MRPISQNQTSEANLLKDLIKNKTSQNELKENVDKETERRRSQKLDNDRKFISNKKDKQKLGLKKVICRWVMKLVQLYLLFVGGLLFLSLLGFGNLSDSVLITLLTTTTINIIGLPWLIIRSLFPSEGDSKNQTSD